MSLGNLGRRGPVTYQERAQGTYGEFTTRSGRVAYLMTNAQLSEAGVVDHQRRLTSKLRPVREVLDVKSMSFAQLLQRDLDDNRVANELVPYLLRVSERGPAFLPPILAVLLPFTADQPSSFDPPTELDDLVEEDGGHYARQAFGPAFAVDRLVDPDTRDRSDLPLGRLVWNEERARLVVLDGQHRAMALLAIDRTLHNGWNDLRSQRYRSFYQPKVRAALAEHTGALEMLQVPVTLCWFPDPSVSPHQAARKLFVDVNKNARPPSRDRLVLLSDEDLADVFTRAMLDRITEPDAQTLLPLASIEYDNPTENSLRHGRWSAIITLQSLLNMTEHTVFGPAKYVTDVTAAIRGRGPVDVGDFFREQLDIDGLFPQEIDQAGGQPFARADLSRYIFPRSVQDSLRQRFLETWGQGLLELLSQVAPFRAHHECLRELESTWEPAALEADLLAREALFEGVGMYWTLRSQALGRRPEDDEAPELAQAWSIIQGKRDGFEERRAELYLGHRATPEERSLVESSYEILESQACQTALALTLATIARAAGSPPTFIPQIASALAQALNAALASGEDGVDLRLVFSRDVVPRANLLASLRPSRAVELRYLWLELLCIGDVAAPVLLAAGLAPDDLRGLTDKARRRYVNHLADERAAALYRENRAITKEQHRQDALGSLHLSLQEALEHWFGLTRERYQAWTSDPDSVVSPDDLEEDD